MSEIEIIREQEMVFIEVETVKEAEKKAPWAECLEEVSGGWMAFRRVSKFEEWKNQN